MEWEFFILFLHFFRSYVFGPSPNILGPAYPHGVPPKCPRLQLQVATGWPLAGIGGPGTGAAKLGRVSCTSSPASLRHHESTYGNFSLSTITISVLPHVHGNPDPEVSTSPEIQVIRECAVVLHIP